MKIDYYKGHRASFYHQTDKGVQCDLCPHACNLSDGQHGICYSRVNHNDILYAETYNKLCAINIDPIEKKPLLHFHPGSSCLSIASTGCNLKCPNCQNWEISQSHFNNTNPYDISPDNLIELCIRKKCRHIAYTYTEPITFYEYMFDCASLAHEHNIQNILVSAGFINQEPLKQLCPLLNAANIDLKSFSEKLYQTYNKAQLKKVLNTLITLKEAGIWLEITNLLIPTVNDNSKLIVDMCKWLFNNGFKETPLHFSRFFPLYKMNIIPFTPLKTLLDARHIAWEAGLKYVYIGNIHEIEGENTICPNCKKTIVYRKQFNVLKNLISHSKCPYCDTTINGVW